MTGHVDVKPYTSWIDFAQHMKHPLSVVNFIAAYGTHASDRRRRRRSTRGATRPCARARRPDDRRRRRNQPRHSLHERRAPRLPQWRRGTPYAGGALGGLNGVDLWIGGLAEEINEFGGQLGSTFNFVFEYQMEHLQNGDRFYYLSRTQGMNLLNLLEPNTFADIIMRNTDLGDLHATHLSAEIMEVPDMILELDTLVAQERLQRRRCSTVSIPDRIDGPRYPAGARSQGLAH